jgi:glycosyltransferase involved in cell wall biosynthesis
MEAGVEVLSPAKLLPLRWRVGRTLHAWRTAHLVEARTPSEAIVVWATHPHHHPLARALRQPIVYDRTDDWPAMDTDVAERALTRMLDQRLLRDAEEVVVVSQRMRAQVQRATHHIPNGVDVAAFARPVDRGSGRLRAGYAGTLDELRLDYRIFAEIARLPGVELAVAGPGQPPAGATHLGTLPHEAVPRFLLSCDVLIAPYRTDAPVNVTSDALKLYEYFATGRPVVATPTAGFERYPDLVIAWPLSTPLATRCREQARHAERRRAVAREADWSVRAYAMHRLLSSVAARVTGRQR